MLKRESGRRAIAPACACARGERDLEDSKIAKKDKKLSTVPLNWKEVYYTNCPLVSASNVDQELGWTKEEFKKLGTNYLYLRARKENDWWRIQEEQGIVDAICTQSGPFQHLQEATGKFKAIEDLSRHPDWTLQVANIPAVITCTDVMVEKHPERVLAFMRGMIKVGRWANEYKRAAAADLFRREPALRGSNSWTGTRRARPWLQPMRWTRPSGPMRVSASAAGHAADTRRRT